MTLDVSELRPLHHQQGHQVQDDLWRQHCHLHLSKSSQLARPPGLRPLHAHVLCCVTVKCCHARGCSRTLESSALSSSADVVNRIWKGYCLKVAAACRLPHQANLLLTRQNQQNLWGCYWKLRMLRQAAADLGLLAHLEIAAGPDASGKPAKRSCFERLRVENGQGMKLPCI